MKINVQVNAGRLRLWMARLVHDLREEGHEVDVTMVPALHSPPTIVDALDLIERTLYGVSTQGWRRATADAFPKSAVTSPGTAYDVVIDLSDTQPSAQGQAGPRRISVLYDGSAADEALVSALLDDRSPMIEIICDGAALFQAVLAVEDRLVPTRSLDQLAERIRSSLEAAVAMPHPVNGSPRPTGSSAAPSGVLLARARGADLVAGLVRKVSLRIDILTGSDVTWRVGVRRAKPEPDRHVSFAATDFHWIRDDGKRFFADPFIFSHGGRTCVFVEEFPYATRKGILSVAEIGAEGVGVPKPFMELDGHLSYPHVFSRDGQVWMIPETSYNRTISLYRCVGFPDQWEKFSVLVTNVDASDTTFLDDGKILWLFTSVKKPGESSWDTLSLYWATDLTGPWTAHAGNPVLLDARWSRPAGAIRRFGSDFVRPAQYCVGGYGRGLALARIDDLSPDRPFRQFVEQLLVPPLKDGVSRLHTINHEVSLEAVDAVLSRRATGRPINS